MRMLERASRAPSGHNAQPWTVTIHSADHWTVGVDASRRLPAVDGDDRELMISLGAFIEALIISGAAEGLEVVPNGLELTLRPMTPKDDQLEALLLRRTIRGPYEARSLSADDVAVFHEATYFAESKILREATIEANRAQAFRDDAQRELIEWVRWTKKEANEKRDGLSLSALGISGVTAWVAGTFLNKQRLLTKSSRESQAVDAGKAIDQSGGWLVLTDQICSRPAVDCFDCGCARVNETSRFSRCRRRSKSLRGARRCARSSDSMSNRR